MAHGAPNKKTRVSTNDQIDDADVVVSNSGPTPPDGGWGWVVAFASFMIHIATDGVTYSFGVFYLQFLNYFDSGKGETAWILSILVGVTYCSGPIASSFVNKYGCRPVTIAGAILSSVCLMISVFAPNIVTLYFTIGIGTGIGFGLIYLPAIVSVTMYFEKYRSLATGIAVCGSGLGTFLFAPLIEYLNDEYGWRGAMLITGALMLNCIIFGALFRPLKYENNENETSSVHEMTDMLSYDAKQNVGLPLKESNAKTDIHVSAHNLRDFQIPAVIITNGNGNGNYQTSITRPHSIGHFTMPRVTKTSSTGIAGPGQNGGNTIVTNGKLKSPDINRMTLSQPMLVSETYYSNEAAPKRMSGPMQRRDVFYQGSLMNIPQFRSKHDLTIQEEMHLMSRRLSHSGHRHHTSHHHVNHHHPLEPPEELDEERLADSTATSCFCCSADAKETLHEMLDFSLFADPIFILFTISNFCTSIGFNIPYVYIVAQATQMGISSTDSSYLLSIIGIANTIGRIILGYLADKPWVNRLCVYNTCLTICGIATFLSAFCYDFYSLSIYAAVFGFTIGAYVGLTSVILVDLLGLDKLTNAFGLLLLFQGIASLIGPPVAGWLYDSLQSYDPGFFVSGSAIALSGIMLYTIPFLQRWRDQKQKKGMISRELAASL